MTSLYNFEPEWICECGQKWRGQDGMFLRSDPLPVSRFMAFGFHSACPRCGLDIGSEGNAKMKMEVCKYVNPPHKRKLFKPSTWKFPDAERVVKGENDV